MGIKHFWQMISGVGEERTLTELSEEYLKNRHRPLRIAVDEANWRYEAPNVAKIQKDSPGSSPIERSIMYRIFRLMGLGIQLIFVFDGDERPVGKRARRTKAGTAGDNVNMVKELLDRLQVPYHQAPAEAEAECVRLQQLGIVDVVWSGDSDVFMFGCSVLIKKKRGSRRDSKQDLDVVEVFRMKDIRDKKKLSREAIILFAMLVGCDYTTGLKDCGLQKALKLVADEDLVKRFSKVDGPATRASWCAHLKSVLPPGIKSVSVDDKAFLRMGVLESCRRPKVSPPDKLKHLRGQSLGGHTLSSLSATIPFLLQNFNISITLETWPLKFLTPIELVSRLVSDKPGARDLIDSLPERRKPKPTTKVKIDPRLVFPGISDRDTQVRLFGTWVELPEEIECEVLDQILRFGLSDDEFQEWRNEKHGREKEKKGNNKRAAQKAPPTNDLPAETTGTSLKRKAIESPPAKEPSSLDAILVGLYGASGQSRMRRVGVNGVGSNKRPCTSVAGQSADNPVILS